jgi:cell division protein FtsI/penicillin-binding protein 2
LQNAAHKALLRHKVSTGAIVAINPETGKILALASTGSSADENPTALRSTFPAASIFKIITAAAAIERAGLDEHSVVPFRGGNYTLNKYNYLPNKKRDGRRIMLGEAFGKSCNPAFARIALKSLDSSMLFDYAEAFSFNRIIPFELSVGESLFSKPSSPYSLARTSAGFENSFISPLHGAMISASIVNQGKTMRPILVENISSVDGIELFSAEPQMLQQSVLPSTAKHLLSMMEYSSEMGTARKHLKKLREKSGKRFRVVGKTGTLSGKSPEGRYHWFVGASQSSPEPIAIASLVIDRGDSRINGTGLAKSFLQEAYELKR